MGHMAVGQHCTVLQRGAVLGHRLGQKLGMLSSSVQTLCCRTALLSPSALPQTFPSEFCFKAQQQLCLPARPLPEIMHSSWSSSSTPLCSALPLGSAMCCPGCCASQGPRSAIIQSVKGRRGDGGTERSSVLHEISITQPKPLTCLMSSGCDRTKTQ